MSKWLLPINIILLALLASTGFFGYRFYVLYETSQNEFSETSRQLLDINTRFESELALSKSRVAELEGRLGIQQKLTDEQKKLIEIQKQLAASQTGKISGLQSELGGAKSEIERTQAEIERLKKLGGEPLPKDFINSLLQATVRVRCLLVRGPRSETVSAGSGSVLGRYAAAGGEYVIMTNAHVVKPKEGTADYDCDIVFGAGYRYDATVLRRVLAGDFDFAFLKLGLPLAEPADVISYEELGVGFCEVTDVAPDDLVTILSYPGFVGPDKAVSEGVITDIFDGPIYEASAFIDLGSSGGVALSNKKHCALGMPTWKGVEDKLGLGYIQSWPMMLSYK